MDYALLIVIFLLIGYIVFKEWITYREREKTQLKLMSKSVGEYQKVIEDIPESSDPEPVTHIPIEDLSVDEILKAKDDNS